MDRVLSTLNLMMVGSPLVFFSLHIYSLAKITLTQISLSLSLTQKNKSLSMSATRFRRLLIFVIIVSGNQP